MSCGSGLGDRHNTIRSPKSGIHTAVSRVLHGDGNEFELGLIHGVSVSPLHRIEHLQIGKSKTINVITKTNDNEHF